jgi:peptidoglycan/LPS O-acetylase OafA/YrhL
MGLLRFLLAAAVVAEHSTSFGGFSIVTGQMAVRLFFIISGFYMALILSTKYTTQPNRYWLFISNRFTRLFPSYYLVLLASLAFYGAASLHLHKPVDRLILWQDALHAGHYLKLALIGLAQLTVVGMDTVCLFSYDTLHGFHWPALAELSDKNWFPGMAGSGAAWRFMFVPQSWSISLELIFYFFAPLWVSLRTRTLLAIGLGSGVIYGLLKFVLSASQLQTVSYFFFPCTMYLFILGILAYRWSKQFLAWLPKRFDTAIAVAAFTSILAYSFLPAVWRDVLCIALVFAAVPILFNRTCTSKAQKYIGDLSYPIYICHILTKWMLLAVLGVTRASVTSPPGWLLLVCSTIFAAGLLWFVEYPVDRWRQRRVKKASVGQRPVVSAPIANVAGSV